MHGVLGENGAGKSTLMKILAGTIHRSSGEILLDGRSVDFAHPAQAFRAGIGMLYQDPLDFPPLTVLENFMLGQPTHPRKSAKTWANLLDALCRDFGFYLDPEAPLESLTLGERQQLELVRLLSLGCRLLILDEPTTGISTAQKELLFRALRRVAQEGRTVLLVSHKLEDAESLCEHVTVLRQGEVTGSLHAPFDVRNILTLMFGTPPPPLRKSARPLARVSLEFQEVSAPGGRAGLREATATFRQGEVVGLAGLEGSGQGVFLRIAAGLQRPTSGRLSFFWRGLHELASRYLSTPRRGVRARRPPERRPHCGSYPYGTLRSGRLRPPFPRSVASGASGGRTKGAAVSHSRLSPNFCADALSGGNQQRLLLSLIPSDASVLLLE
ncbi:MAG: ATP-binding cassette domain-containing protein [Desulfosoma sp.]|uniref:ATP-binding cassette domain-containing protein n=1 Tax=Desulfosoma sp. TaxID=2603217 RepID=UPI0040493CE1